MFLLPFLLRSLLVFIPFAAHGCAHALLLFAFFISLLSLFSCICYYFHPLFSLLSALVSLLFSLFSSVFPAARRLSRSELGSAAPCLQGSRACGTQARLRQIELRGAPHLPPTPPSWPASPTYPIAPNAILEPPMASKMQSWSLRWPPDRQIMQMSSKR